MRKISYVVAVLGATLLLAACAGDTMSEPDEKSYNAAYEAAEAARKEAASMKYEWRDTAKMLKKAEETAGKGDYATAQKLANKARKQSENAIAQAKEQEQAWQAAVLK